jgi:hypothetical protein
MARVVMGTFTGRMNELWGELTDRIDASSDDLTSESVVEDRVDEWVEEMMEAEYDFHRIIVENPDMMAVELKGDDPRLSARRVRPSIGVWVRLMAATRLYDEGVRYWRGWHAL